MKNVDQDDTYSDENVFKRRKRLTNDLLTMLGIGRWKRILAACSRGADDAFAFLAIDGFIDDDEVATIKPSMDGIIGDGVPREQFDKFIDHVSCAIVMGSDRYWHDILTAAGVQAWWYKGQEAPNLDRLESHLARETLADRQADTVWTAGGTPVMIFGLEKNGSGLNGTTGVVTERIYSGRCTVRLDDDTWGFRRIKPANLVPTNDAKLHFYIKDDFQYGDNVPVLVKQVALGTGVEGARVVVSEGPFRGASHFVPTSNLRVRRIANSTAGLFDHATSGEPTASIPGPSRLTEACLSVQEVVDADALSLEAGDGHSTSATCGKDARR